MMNVPGISWGPDSHINLMRSSKGWLAVYYDNPISRPEIIKVFKPKNYYEYYQMRKTVTKYNYHTCALCPEVRIEMSWIS